MKKAVFLLSVVLGLLLTLTARSNQISFIFTEGDYPVYRFQDSVGGFIWTKLGVSTDVVVKEIVFDVYLSLDDDAPFTAAPIPAGVADDRVQWTKVTPVGNHWEFKYWTPDSLQYFIPIADNQRLLDFYVKFQTEIPARGFLNIKLTNFRVKGVNADGLTINVAAPSVVEINVNLGSEPFVPDSLFLQASWLINRPDNEVRVMLSYWGAAWDTLEFVLLVPPDLSLRALEPGLLSLSYETNNNGPRGIAVKLFSRYSLPPTRPHDWHYIMSMVFNFNRLSGSRRIVLDDIKATMEDTVLAVDKKLVIDIDFGPLTAVEDRQRSEVSVEVCGDYFYYRLTLPQNWQLNIFDYLGSEVKEEKSWGAEGQVNLESLRTSIYFYQFKIDSMILRGKFIIY